MIRLLQRMDDTQPRHAEGGATGAGPTLRPVTLLADAGETAETALEDWSRGLDWVHWLFSSIRQRQAGIHFHAADLPQPGLYPRSPVTRQALAARWENFAQKDLRGPLGLALVQAWQVARDLDLVRLQELDAELDAALTGRARADSREAGARLLQGTRGARYQGLLGRYRTLQEESRTPGHFFIVWPAAAHFFQLSLASTIAEYIRLEWDLATRHLPAPAAPLSLQSITTLTGHLMHARVSGLTLLGQSEDEESSQPQKTGSL
ncbi:urease accessory UreF family protein [Prosthecobacter sp. SYSU 5D2]|uniref:urease accessory UreF family protein n=1 Tax=Prosthecobacter sp. SYSU 5D2 TaxID=3134134 RepID=UPI0031FF05C4